MKRILMSTAILAVILGSTTSVLAGAPPGYRTLVSAKHHYHIAYPVAWQAKASSTGQQFFYGQVVNGFKTNVNVYIVPGVRKMTLDQLRNAIAQADRTGGASVSSTSRMKVGSIDAGQISGNYKRTVRGKVVHDRFVTAAFSAGGLVWEITYSAAPSAFTATYPVFTTMLSSFVLTK